MILKEIPEETKTFFQNRLQDSTHLTISILNNLSYPYYNPNLPEHSAIQNLVNELEHPLKKHLITEPNKLIRSNNLIMLQSLSENDHQNHWKDLFSRLRSQDLDQLISVLREVNITVFEPDSDIKNKHPKKLWQEIERELLQLPQDLRPVVKFLPKESKRSLVQKLKESCLVQPYLAQLETKNLDGQLGLLLGKPELLESLNAFMLQFAKKEIETSKAELHDRQFLKALKENYLNFIQKLNSNSLDQYIDPALYHQQSEELKIKILQAIKYSAVSPPPLQEALKQFFTLYLAEGALKTQKHLLAAFDARWKKEYKQTWAATLKQGNPKTCSLALLNQPLSKTSAKYTAELETDRLNFFDMSGPDLSTYSCLSLGKENENKLGAHVINPNTQLVWLRNKASGQNSAAFF